MTIADLRKIYGQTFRGRRVFVFAAMAREYDHLFKLLIIGDSGKGGLQLVHGGLGEACGHAVKGVVF